MEMLSVVCSSYISNYNLSLNKGDQIPVTRNNNGTCVLKFNDGRKPITIPEVELYSCGFIVDVSTEYYR